MMHDVIQDNIKILTLFRFAWAHFFVRRDSMTFPYHLARWGFNLMLFKKTRRANGCLTYRHEFNKAICFGIHDEDFYFPFMLLNFSIIIKNNWLKFTLYIIKLDITDWCFCIKIWKNIFKTKSRKQWRIQNVAEILKSATIIVIIHTATPIPTPPPPMILFWRKWWSGWRHRCCHLVCYRNLHSLILHSLLPTYLWEARRVWDDSEMLPFVWAA